MFEVELKYNGVTQYKKTFEAPVRIEELTQGLEIPESGILSYKHNYKHYVGPTFQVTEDAVIDCISYSDPEGYRIYQDSALFIMTKAFCRESLRATRTSTMRFVKSIAGQPGITSVVLRADKCNEQKENRGEYYA